MRTCTWLFLLSPRTLAMHWFQIQGLLSLVWAYWQVMTRQSGFQAAISTPDLPLKKIVGKVSCLEGVWKCILCEHFECIVRDRNIRTLRFSSIIEKGKWKILSVLTDLASTIFAQIDVSFRIDTNISQMIFNTIKVIVYRVYCRNSLNAAANTV